MAAAVNQSNDSSIQTATLGGGCFWCLEAVFERVRGVLDVESGYAGGVTVNPTYAQVCAGDSGHAEVVRIVFDSQEVSYRQLLEGFFGMHDPTTLNRQGADIGTQYRSVIFYHDEAQATMAHEVMAEVRQALGVPLTTECLPLPAYYPAEPEHQDYFRHHPSQGYCQAVIAPKLARFRQNFAQLLVE